jgi:hypothetical protein
MIDDVVLFSFGTILVVLSIDQSFVRAFALEAPRVVLKFHHPFPYGDIIRKLNDRVLTAHHKAKS